MDKDTMTRVASGVARGEYSLLLGAGASMGAIGGNGQSLPSGPQLRDTLAKKFHIDSDNQSIPLSRIYSAAQRQDPTGLNEFLCDWFTECTLTWQSILPNSQWHRIWTLNIDDVVERAYSCKGIHIDRFDWTSKHRDTFYAPNQVIHLHGFVDKETDPKDQLRNLVFSINDYTATLRDSRTWHAVFEDEFVGFPFIVLGASLVEEFDLYQALKNGSSSATYRGLPSVIVLKNVSQLERAELNDFGLIVIESDAETFMHTLYQDAQKLSVSLAEEYGQEPNSDFSRFLQQFVDLRKYEPISNELSHDFYSGYEPQWFNIQNDDDAPLNTTVRAFSKIIDESNGESVSQGIHILTGPPGTGKSTGLLRIAQHLISNGLLPFLFRGDENVDLGATISWLKTVPQTILLFDNCADFADSLMHLAMKCEEFDIPLLIVGTERRIRQKILRDKIHDKFLHLDLEYEYSLLTDKDIESLIVKLESKRRLGRITRRNQRQRRDYFRRTASRRLFDGMASLEGGEGFRVRIKNSYQHIRNERLRAIYAASSISYQLGHPLSVGIASKIAGITVRVLEEWLTELGVDTLIITPQGIRPPHRITAAIVVDSALSREERFDAVYDLMFALAPHVDRNASRSRTRHYRLLGRLMDEETIIRLVGYEKGRDVYEAIQSAYDWNGRYWEQRALFESRLGNHTQARSYAERSLQISHHPFAHNTLGTILGRIAAQNCDVDMLRESVNALKSARDARNWDTSEHPYVTFFSTMNRFGQSYGLALIPIPLRNDWTEWYGRARQELFFSHPQGREQLRKFQSDWLHLATVQVE